MKRVLVVDDEPAIRAVLEDILRDQGFDVIVASSGRQMLELLESERPALILLDVMMPDGDGRDAFRAMQSRPDLRAIPVVMMSAAVVAQGLSRSIAGYLAKPFDLDHLLEIVNRLIGSASR